MELKYLHPLREEDCSGVVIVSHEGCHELENIYLLVDVLKGSTIYKHQFLSTGARNLDFNVKCPVSKNTMTLKTLLCPLIVK